VFLKKPEYWLFGILANRAALAFLINFKKNEVELAWLQPPLPALSIAYNVYYVK
jgi:hypothetical protein